MEKLPVLKVTKSVQKINGSTKLYVWCPFCRKEHIHGLPNGQKLPQHRVAHCAGLTPLTESGYVIRN
jgi:hypothetical protein